MNFVLFAGSLRSGSLNKKLLNIIKKIIETKTEHKAEIVDIKSLNIPLYDGDIETAGMPSGVLKLGELIQKADAVIISSPEYNGSISSPLKNTIDWVSRLRPIPLEKKPILLTGASPGNFGTIRAQTHAKPCLDTLKAYVFHTPYMLAKAAEAFNDQDELVSDENKKRLTDLIISFSDYTKALSGH